ncbi:tRNA-splicing endonuclease subunit, partial [Nowakowskiella sp. JEL0078]
MSNFSLTVSTAAEFPELRPENNNSINAEKYQNLEDWISLDLNLERTKVFEEFWKMGWWVSCASKFGGDFLLYPDDPMHCHSSFIVTVHHSLKKFTPIEIVSYGRLATTVKKKHILCSYDVEKEEITSVVLEWA